MKATVLLSQDIRIKADNVEHLTLCLAHSKHSGDASSPPSVREEQGEESELKKGVK